ncbi:hypothetical protein PGSY75_1218900 [Plasmodium gaboni]|uniref:Uncharacterized protein n=1 Tax=Plasmodium gaboni TaxID=647221 RepID=A0A151LGL0_9APIC|nr:hypothetical protein PGSY75_1218900 [Plasmodium gaboni]KYN97999.1 hypothetical protein PGSY75_1218900 [Plasmodium gaboni]
MRKEFIEYNKKYFRNIQFVYDFLNKIGMKNSLNELKKESKIDYIEDYDLYFLDQNNQDISDDENIRDEEEEDEDFEDIDKTFFIYTMNKMNNSILCKAIDLFDQDMKDKYAHLQNVHKVKNMNDKRSDMYENYNINNNNNNNDDNYSINNFDEYMYQTDQNNSLTIPFMKEKKENIFLSNDNKEYECLKLNNTNIVTQKVNMKSYNWDTYFTQEKEIYKKLNVTIVHNDISNNINDKVNKPSNILCIKYIDIYYKQNYKHINSENIIFFQRFFPLFLLVGYANGSINLFLIIYENKKKAKEQNGNNDINEKEEYHNDYNIYLYQQLEHISLGSPVMHIDINYQDNLFIVSTMNGDICICQINMNKIESIKNKFIQTNDLNLDTTINNDNPYMFLKDILKYHMKYSIQCLFNEDYSLFCSIANDKNLIIYEKIVSNNKMNKNTDDIYSNNNNNNIYDDTTNYTYEKKKIIGLPDIPTNILWVKHNNKEVIIISMLNSNHIIFMNSANYIIENKLYLFDLNKDNKNENDESKNEKHNILALDYHKNKNILVICTDTSKIFVYSFKEESIIKIIYGCVLNSLSFPTIQIDISGNFIYVTSEDKVHGTYILIFDIKSGNIINTINNGFKIRCFQLLKNYICPSIDDVNSNNIDANKKALLILGSFDKKLHFYSN